MLGGLLYVVEPMSWVHQILVLYRCEVQTVAVHDDSDLSVRETVYVGLYASRGIRQRQC